MKSSSTNQRAFSRLKEKQCYICGENRIPALMRFEKHHLIGKKEGPTTAICRNCHAVIESRKPNWNPELLEEHRTSYKKFLAFLMGMTDTVLMISENTITYAALLNNSDKDVTLPYPFNELKISDLLSRIGSLGIIVMEVLQKRINGIVDNKSLEQILNDFIKSHENEIKKITNYFNEVGL